MKTRGTSNVNVNGKCANGQHVRMTAQDRINQLRAAGICVDNFFAMAGANGGEYIGILDQGKLSVHPVEQIDNTLSVMGVSVGEASMDGASGMVVGTAGDAAKAGATASIPEEDFKQMIESIKEEGTVHNAHLHRRWIMSQIFHMLLDAEKNGNFTEQIRRKGVDYQWKVLRNEYYAQMKMQQHEDMGSLVVRQCFYDGDVLVMVLKDYERQLRTFIDKAPVRHCKGEEYKRIGSKMFYVSEIDERVLRPLGVLIGNAKSAVYTKEYYQLISTFLQTCYYKFKGLKMANEFVDAYKGAGAYYTLDNMIKFHGCLMKGCANEAESLENLQSTLEAYEGEGWRLLGVLKQTLELNNIDIAAKIRSWRKH